MLLKQIISVSINCRRMKYQIKHLFAEEVGFEPTIQLILYKDLADLRFKPLSHSSKLLIQ
jgi:hypothetical protein